MRVKRASYKKKSLFHTIKVIFSTCFRRFSKILNFPEFPGIFPVLARIAPPALRREYHTSMLVKKALSDPSHVLHAAHCNSPKPRPPTPTLSPTLQPPSSIPSKLQLQPNGEMETWLARDDKACAAHHPPWQGRTQRGGGGGCSASKRKTPAYVKRQQTYNTSPAYVKRQQTYNTSPANVKSLKICHP